ncbi:facilitated trehalose transporter Tret1 isoform X2 [Bemisia tabaci]|uniref:facilitated trehalose transporter Tret1 isoform X2 n=1 Tax=Bemisia tabaci TaxID=7038 RepID=UPI003B28BA82
MITTDVELNQALGKNDSERDGSDESLPKAVSRFRSALPQVLATTAKNLILLDLGMTIAFPTIVIPTLLDGKDPSGLTFNTAQASWFGSIAFICQPLGSVLSGIVLEPLGRKRSMLLVNVPHLIGWILFYNAESLSILYITCALMGLGVGFMEAPIITYVGEISEPALRGILTSYSGIFVSVGFLFEYTLGNFVDWRTAALISAMVPVITLIAISQVPETPTWLLSKGRNEEAKKSLQWLRGWVPVGLIMDEFDQLKRYNEATRYHAQVTSHTVSSPDVNEKPRPVSYANDVSIDDELTKPDMKTNGNAYSVNGGVSPVGAVKGRKLSFEEKFYDLIRPEMVRPLGLVVVFFFIFYSCGPPGMRPYMIKLFDKMNLPVTGKRVTVIMGLIGILGNIFCMICVKWCGKRPLSLVSTAGSAASIIILGFCALDAVNGPAAVPGAQSIKWTPFVLFCSLWFFSNFGLSQIPWMLTSEVFPNRGRGLASGIAAACSYLMAFVASKTYPDLERYLGIHGVCFLYGTLTLLGYIFIYFCLPETEGRSLAEIEGIYSTQQKAEKKAPSS